MSHRAHCLVKQYIDIAGQASIQHIDTAYWIVSHGLNLTSLSLSCLYFAVRILPCYFVKALSRRSLLGTLPLLECHIFSEEAKM